MFEKVEVNGAGRHPVYEELAAVPDGDGEAGDIQWNFEKFLVSPTGEIVRRFRPMVDPEAPEVIDAIEANLPGLTVARASGPWPGRPTRRIHRERGSACQAQRQTTSPSSTA